MTLRQLLIPTIYPYIVIKDHFGNVLYKSKLGDIEAYLNVIDTYGSHFVESIDVEEINSSSHIIINLE